MKLRKAEDKQSLLEFFDESNQDGPQYTKFINKNYSVSRTFPKQRLYIRDLFENLNKNKSSLNYRKMSSVGASKSGGVTGAAAVAAENLHLPPLRSIADFALGSARFQLPNMRDLEKWGNRVVKNLLYYQTNYFLLLIGIYGLMAALHPLKIISGLLVQAMLIAIFLHFFREKDGSKASFIASRIAAAQGVNQVNLQQKWYFLTGALLIGFLLLYWFDAILLSSFTLLLPISITFVHASLRLRNIRNKVANTMESFGPSTPMGVFLDAMNITADNILS